MLYEARRLALVAMVLCGCGPSGEPLVDPGTDAGSDDSAVVEDVLYLKTDDETRPAYLKRELDPFSYTTKEGKAYAMSYHRAPDEAVEGPDAMREWLRPALGAALRNAQKKPRTAALRRARGRPA